MKSLRRIGSSRRGARLAQVVERAAEVRLLGEHRQRRRAAALVGARRCRRSVVPVADLARRRRAPLVLGDQRHARARAAPPRTGALRARSPPGARARRAGARACDAHASRVGVDELVEHVHGRAHPRGVELVASAPRSGRAPRRREPASIAARGRVDALGDRVGAGRRRRSRRRRSARARSRAGAGLAGEDRRASRRAFCSGGAAGARRRRRPPTARPRRRDNVVAPHAPSRHLHHARRARMLEISSSPSSLDTTSARSAPKPLQRARHRLQVARGRRRRSAGACAPAGLVSGPSRLKIVRTPSSRADGHT